MHSGLQLGGVPIICGEQEQTGTSFFTLHSEFGPHGEGEHGLIGSYFSGVFGGKLHRVNGSPIERNY